MPTKSTDKLPATDWLPFFARADILTQALAETHSAKAKTIKIGQFLSPNVNRPVPIQVDGRSGLATLRVESKKHAKSKRYFFEITWDEPETSKKKAKTNKTTKPNKVPVKTQPAPSKAASTKVPSSKKPVPKVSKPGNDEKWE